MKEVNAVAPADGPRVSTTEALRIGLIVPSSNVTMERELPELLRRREAIAPERFSFHTARVRMKSVTPEELAAMNAQADRACAELADARIDLLAYACLVAVMAEGAGAHARAEARIGAALTAEGCDAPVVTSAGALVTTLRDIGAARIGMIAPYAPALTDRVRAYLQSEGIEVCDVRSLNVTDNTAVGRLDPAGLIPLADGLKSDVDAVVLSACVQMPSLASIEIAEQRLGVPVLSAATATVFQLLRRLNLRTIVPGAGRLLSGSYDPPPLRQPVGREAA